MKPYIIIGAVVLVVFGLWFLTSERSGQKDEDVIVSLSDSQPAAPEEEKEANIEDTKKMTTAILHTNKGDITIEFFEAQTPKTVANFIKLAKEGFYDGVKFHRVIKGFMIQGGDPLSKDDSKINLWGTGGPGYSFEDEIGGTNKSNKNDKGTISMANAGPNTNGSQFFINAANNNFLDAKHTVFGKVASGMDVVTEIENTPTGSSDRPITPIVIKNVSLK